MAEGVVRKKRRKSPFNLGGLGACSPRKILKSRCSEMQFSTFWTSNRVVFMKIVLVMWRLFYVKNRVSFLTQRVRSVKTGKCCESEHQGRRSRGGWGGFSPPLLRRMTFYFVLVYGTYKEI